MGSVTARVTQNSSLAFVEHPTTAEDTWQLIHSSTTAADGADGGTVVDTVRDSGAADTYTGRYWIHITSGANKGLWKRIPVDDGSGGYSMEGISTGPGFPNQVLADVTYELWLSPEPVIVVTSAQDNTVFFDTARTEADNYWIGYYAVVLTGTQRGEKGLIFDFITSTGEIRVTGIAGALAQGDVCLLRRYVDATSVSDGLAHGFNTRPAHRLDGSRGDGSLGVKSGTFGFDAAATGVYRVGGNTVSAEHAGLLKACGFVQDSSNVSTGATTPSVSTGTQIEIDTATWDDYTIGGGISVEGQQAFITAAGDGGGGDDNLTITPSLGTTVPEAGATIPRTINYFRNRRADHGNYGAVTLVHEVDGIRTTMTGCKGNLTISGDTDLMFGFEFQVDHYIREVKTEPAPVYTGDGYPSYLPIQAHQRRCYFGATAVELGGISASLNNEVGPRKVQGGYGINGRAGFGHSGTNPGVTCRKLMSATSTEELDADERWFSRTSHDLMIFWGDRLYGGCALRIPAARLVAEPKPEDDEGMQVTPFVFEACSAGSTTDPDSTRVKIPDFVLSFS